MDEISLFALRIISHNVLEINVHTISNLRSVQSIAHAMTTQCSSNIQLCILNPHLDEVFYSTKRGAYLCAAHERHLRVATKTSLSDKLQLTIFFVTFAYNSRLHIQWGQIPCDGIQKRVCETSVLI